MGSGISVTVDNMNLEQIAESGQCFRWNICGPCEVETVAFGHVLHASQNGDEYTFSIMKTPLYLFRELLFSIQFDFLEGYKNIAFENENDARHY